MVGVEEVIFPIGFNVVSGEGLARVEDKHKNFGLSKPKVKLPCAETGKGLEGENLLGRGERGCC